MKYSLQVKALLEYGQSVGPFFPWHYSSDPYQWAVAELLLKRTTRTAAARAFQDLISSFPTWQSLAAAPVSDLRDKVAPVGLGDQRAGQLNALAEHVCRLYQGDLPRDRNQLLKLPGFGQYTVDAVLLYVWQEKVFPIDGNVQRLLRRLVGLPKAEGTTLPYRDGTLIEVVREILDQSTAQETLHIHRAILHIAWGPCRPLPNCPVCPIRAICVYGQARTIELSCS